jgi:hypothetical protein
MVSMTPASSMLKRGSKNKSLRITAASGKATGYSQGQIRRETRKAHIVSIIDLSGRAQLDPETYRFFLCQIARSSKNNNDRILFQFNVPEHPLAFRAINFGGASRLRATACSVLYIPGMRLFGRHDYSGGHDKLRDRKQVKEEGSINGQKFEREVVCG